MSWNYRLVKYHTKPGYGVHEVYYTEGGGKAVSMTTLPINLTGMTREYVRSEFCTILKDVFCKPVFHEPKRWQSVSPACKDSVEVDPLLYSNSQVAVSLLHSREDPDVEEDGG